MAKQIAFNAEARAKLAKGVNTLADAVTVTVHPDDLMSYAPNGEEAEK